MMGMLYGAHQPHYGSSRLPDSGFLGLADKVNLRTEFVHIPLPSEVVMPRHKTLITRFTSSGCSTKLHCIE